MKIFSHPRSLLYVGMVLGLGAFWTAVFQSPAFKSESLAEPSVSPEERRERSEPRRLVMNSRPERSTSSEAEYQVSYDLNDAISAFESMVQNENHNLSSDELQSLDQLISNLNQYQNHEDHR